MAETIKIYVVGDAYYYADWIDDYILVDNQEEADVVFFTGGEDVDPSMYGHDNVASNSNKLRDLKEKAIFEKMRPNQLALGVCRGAQWLTVANGGKLYQDVRNHAIYGTHQITNGTWICEITSTHHQMMYPFSIEPAYYNILWWTPQRLSGTRYLWGGDGLSFRHPSREPEIVRYDVPNNPISLAIQGHPEMMRKESPTLKMLNKLLRSCLKDSQSQTC